MAEWQASSFPTVTIPPARPLAPQDGRLPHPPALDVAGLVAKGWWYHWSVCCSGVAWQSVGLSIRPEDPSPLPFSSAGRRVQPGGAPGMADHSARGQWHGVSPPPISLKSRGTTLAAVLNLQIFINSEEDPTSLQHPHPACSGLPFETRVGHRTSRGRLPLHSLEQAFSSRSQRRLLSCDDRVQQSSAR